MACEHVCCTVQLSSACPGVWQSTAHASFPSGIGAALAAAAAPGAGRGGCGRLQHHAGAGERAIPCLLFSFLGSCCGASEVTTACHPVFRLRWHACCCCGLRQLHSLLRLPGSHCHWLSRCFASSPSQIDYREERKMAVQDFFKSRSKLWLRRLLHGRSGMGATPLTGGPPATEAAAAAALAAALAEAAGRGGGDAVESSSRGSSSSIGGGGFVDTFRHFHPTRQSAFTCWSTATNARSEQQSRAAPCSIWARACICLQPRALI